MQLFGKAGVERGDLVHQRSRRPFSGQTVEGQPQGWCGERSGRPHCRAAVGEWESRYKEKPGEETVGDAG